MQGRRPQDVELAMIDTGECFRLNIAMIFLSNAIDGLPVVVDFTCGCEQWPATAYWDGASFAFACSREHAWFPGQTLLEKKE